MTFFCESVQVWFFSSNAEKLQKQESKVSRQKIGFEQGQKGLNKGLDKLDAAQEGCSKNGFNKIFFFCKKLSKSYLPNKRLAFIFAGSLPLFVYTKENHACFRHCAGAFAHCLI